jgi:hypothetical protein
MPLWASLNGRVIRQTGSPGTAAGRQAPERCRHLVYEDEPSRFHQPPPNA